MAFDYHTDFPSVDPTCIAKFSRTFAHLDWIDGESIVQAEDTPAEEGFNARFHKVENDLDALGTDAKQALECLASMRASLRALLDEIREEFNRAPVENWRDATSLQSNWRPGIIDNNGVYNRPGFFKDPSGMVHLRGIVEGGLQPDAGNTWRSVIFQLPADYRPEYRQGLSGMSCVGPNNKYEAKAVMIEIENITGNVVLRSGYSVYVSLDGLQFSAR